ncbi:MAG: hypothetical protein LYZ66_06625 [Nitrososphaerales archaeon]|nr:hypothetical protein [Nitrososphaerales archaeon]
MYQRCYYLEHREVLLAKAKVERVRLAELRGPIHRRFFGRKYGESICLRCGADYVPKSASQKFCPPCGPLAFKEMARLRTMEYCRRYPEKVRESRRRTIQKRREYYRALKHAYALRYTNKIKRIVMRHYSRGSMACECCGESEMDFLSIDHVYGNGFRHRMALFGKPVGGYSFYSWLIKNKFPSGYAVLCMNCNMSKGKHAVCVHKRKIPPIDERTMVLERWIELAGGSESNRSFDGRRPTLKGNQNPDSFGETARESLESNQALLSVFVEPAKGERS